MKYQNLKILSELREKGSITEEEYQREKDKILNEYESERSSFNTKPLFGLTQDTYLMLLHLSQFAIFVIPVLGIIIPILLWLSQKDINPLVDKQGKDIINFNISFIIYSIVLTITIIGIPLLIVLGIIYFVYVIKATINAYKGNTYKPYPLTIQIIK